MLFKKKTCCNQVSEQGESKIVDIKQTLLKIY